MVFVLMCVSVCACGCWNERVIYYIAFYRRSCLYTKKLHIPFAHEFTHMRACAHTKRRRRKQQPPPTTTPGALRSRLRAHPPRKVKFSWWKLEGILRRRADDDDDDEWAE